MKLRKYYPTLVLSDIHLGSEHSRTEEVTNFLKHVNCDRLILNGDIIDGWQLQKSGRRWKQQQTDFFKVLMKMMEKQGTEIIYIRGNHDDFLNTHGKRYLVTHGDIFDTVTTNMRWLAMLGDMGYTFLLWLNRIYNQRREKVGKPYFSLSQHVKHKVKSAVPYIFDFEKELVKLAEAKKLDGIICGHIHQAANVRYGNIHYLNSGDWVESLTALVENEQGEWNIVSYSKEDYDRNEKVSSGLYYAEVI